MKVYLKDGRRLEQDMVVPRDYYSLNWGENVKMVHRVFRELGMVEDKAEGLLDFVSHMEMAPNVQPILDLVGKR